MKRSNLIIGILAASVGLGASALMAQALVEEVEVRPLGSLAGQQPRLPDLTGIVADRNAAIALGKALFWDMQAGSDGVACASCHFQAGADSRTVNQLSPGLLDKRGLQYPYFGGTDGAGTTSGGNPAAPNVSLGPEDFPLHKLADENNRKSQVLYTTNDVVSSAGTFGGTITGIVPGNPVDACTPGTNDIFRNVHGQQTRVVEPRNTPTTINAIFNVRNFWDGRANWVFNGVDPFGNRSPDAFVVETVGRTGVATRRLALTNASLASQAVGPPLSSSESSCAGRIFPQLGRKLGSLRPLAQQQVHPQDSRLGGYRHVSGVGLNRTYSELIRLAFNSKYWSATGKWTRNGSTLTASTSGYTQQELNFSMFWGISIMLYESLLVSDQSPFDRHMSGLQPFAPDSPEARGLALFTGKGACVDCHDGPLLSTATATATPGLVNQPLDPLVVERMLMASNGSRPAIYDIGFYNIGVRPTVEDVGIGGTDPWGNPLSFTRQFVQQSPFARAIANQVYKDPFKVDPCLWDQRVTENAPETCGDGSPELRAIVPTDERVAIDGAFKTPTLRNVGLTAPYFHNGGYATLESVVRFYGRGGNRRAPSTADEIEADDNSGTGLLGNGDPVTNLNKGSNLAAEIEAPNAEAADMAEGQTVVPKEGFTDQEVSDLVAFLLTLTDQRVACRSGDFDHPQLVVPHGHVDDPSKTTGNAVDYFDAVLPATGRDGSTNCFRNSGDLFLR